MDLTSIHPKHKRRARELEKQLREKVHQYQLLFKATNDMLYDIDIQRKVVTWNDALYRQYGYRRTKRATTLEWWISHVHPDDTAILEAEIEQWFDNKHSTTESEYRLSKADGTYIFVRSRSLIQRSHEGVPIRVIGSLQDVTKQTQLIRAKDEFISLVSHQLRTPLTAIRVYSEMLTSGMFDPLNEKQTAPVQQITDSSIRLIKLVDDILSISRIELGSFAVNPTPMNIDVILKKHISEILPLAQKRRVTVQLDVDPTIKNVPIDVTIFDQVIHNLLTNAIRYAKDEAGTVRVTFGKNKKGYLLTIKDNGIGIPEWAKGFIFNRFFRADNAIKASENGTGIGLYLIKMMLDVSDCTIWFKSAESKGTTFYVQIPRKGMGIAK